MYQNHENAYIHTISLFPPEEIASLNFIPTAAKQKRLRKQVMKSAGCLVTGWDNPIECECAHIVPKACGYNMNFKDVDTPNNCCILSNGMHALFDNMVWTFDIYYLMDKCKNKSRTFTTKIICCRNKRNGKSILNNYLNSEFQVPIANFPSFFLHYYAYHIYNYSNTNDIKEVYNDVWNRLKHIYDNLKTCKSVAQIKKYIIRLRQEQTGSNSAVCILGRAGEYYRILWDYYSYSHASNETLSTVESTVVYEDYQQRQDPDYIPNPSVNLHQNIR